MSTIDIAFKDKYAVINLNRPKGHALNQEMVNDLTEAFVKLAEAPSVDRTAASAALRVRSGSSSLRRSARRGGGRSTRSRR